MQPLQNTKVTAYVSNDPEKRTEWANYWLTNGFDGKDRKGCGTDWRTCA
jgi:hypothetical protein